MSLLYCKAHCCLSQPTVPVGIVGRCRVEDGATVWTQLGVIGGVLARAVNLQFKSVITQLANFDSILVIVYKEVHSMTNSLAGS